MRKAENLDFSRNFRLLGYVPGRIRTAGLPLRRSPDHCQSKSCSVHTRHAVKAFLLLFKSFLFTIVQIVSGQLLSASVNPEQPVDISRILAAANKRCSAYCQRLPKGSATMPALAGMIYNIQLIRFTIYTIPCNGQFVYVFSTTSFLSYKLIFSIISFLPKILSNPIFSNKRFAFSLVPGSHSVYQ